MLLSVVEGSNNSSSKPRRVLATRQLVEIRILTALQSKMEGQACPWMCVFLSPIPLNPHLTLVIEVVVDSDHLESEDEAPTGRRRKVSQATLEKQKMAAKKRAKKHKDDDDDYEDGDEYTALSKSFWTSKPSNAKPSVGSLEKCAKCSKQFTMVRPAVVMWQVSCLL